MWLIVVAMGTVVAALAWLAEHRGRGGDALAAPSVALVALLLFVVAAVAVAAFAAVNAAAGLALCGLARFRWIGIAAVPVCLLDAILAGGTHIAGPAPSHPLLPVFAWAHVGAALFLVVPLVRASPSIRIMLAAASVAVALAGAGFHVIPWRIGIERAEAARREERNARENAARETAEKARRAGEDRRLELAKRADDERKRKADEAARLEARRPADARVALGRIRDRLEQWLARDGRYPSSLAIVFEEYPAPPARDPWGRPWLFHKPGPDDCAYAVGTLGADGRAGGDHANADVWLHSRGCGK